MPLTEVRYLTKEQATPAWIDIFKDQIIIFNIENIPTATLIQDQDTAENFRKYFEIIWQQAEKI